jgi:thioredoxin 1
MMGDNNMNEVTDATFRSEVLESSQPVMVDFWAPWCGPCKSLGPVVENIAATYGDGVKFVKVNVDNAAHTSNAYNIRGIPTLMFFNAGRPVGELVGVHPRETILAKIREIQTAAKAAGARPAGAQSATAGAVITCRACGQKNRVPTSRLREAVCGRCHQPLASP